MMNPQPDTAERPERFAPPLAVDVTVAWGQFLTRLDVPAEAALPVIAAVPSGASYQPEISRLMRIFKTGAHRRPGVEGAIARDALSIAAKQGVGEHLIGGAGLMVMLWDRAGALEATCSVKVGGKTVAATQSGTPPPAVVEGGPLRFLLRLDTRSIDIEAAPEEVSEAATAAEKRISRGEFGGLGDTDTVAARQIGQMVADGAAGFDRSLLLGLLGWLLPRECGGWRPALAEGGHEFEGVIGRDGPEFVINWYMRPRTAA